MKYTVIVIDDSPLARQILKNMINQIDGFEVVDTACDAYDAREKIKLHEPDIVTIDINMPKMDGVSFLKNLMRLHPMPAFVVTSEAAKHREVFDDGAIGFIKKQLPDESAESFFERLRDTLLRYTFLYDRYQKTKPTPKGGFLKSEYEDDKDAKLHPDVVLPYSPAPRSNRKIVAIGASAGGIEALLEIFAALPSNLPPIVITQHIPYGFSGNFAKRLDSISQVSVMELNQMEPLRDGFAYLAPGNRHLIVKREETTRAFVAAPLDGPRITRHRPSVDVMLRSVNNLFGASAMGVILTGMGDDGAIGLKELADNGAYTIAQDEKTSLVFGMPKKAYETGGAKELLPLPLIPRKIVEYGGG